MTTAQTNALAAIRRLAALHFDAALITVMVRDERTGKEDVKVWGQGGNCITVGLSAIAHDKILSQQAESEEDDTGEDWKKMDSDDQGETLS